MAAVLLAPHPHPTPRRPALRVVDRTETTPRARSRSITPPPRTRPTPATYRRRRVLALLVAASVAVGAYLAVSSVLDRPDDVSVVTSPLAAAPAADSPAPVTAPGSDVYVVRPGDTVWSIASSLQPDGDVRDLVDQLTDRAGGSSLQAGQRIALDGLGL